jgi:hypothetical protein
MGRALNVNLSLERDDFRMVGDSEPLLHTSALACHTSHLTSEPFKPHSQGLPSSRCIESARTPQGDQ